MVCTTIKHELRSALEDLSKSDFLTFCHHLRDRREEPRVRYRDVEDRSLLQITDLLVSTFTEPKALLVTLEILRQINCNEEAEALYSKTKDCVDKGDPTFRKTSTGKYETNPSQEAQNHTAGQWSAGHGGPPVTVKKPEEVEAEAKARVLSDGGDPHNARLVLSRFTIQFGQYIGQTFKWLLENDVSYTGYLVAGHQKQRQDTMSQSPLMANKDSLTRYAIAYPEVLKEVRFQRACDRSQQSRQKGKALVGFGLHRSETLQDLYNSKDKHKISYVNFLRDMKSTCEPGTKMDVAVKYVLQRDQKQAAAEKRKRVQSIRGQPAGASKPIRRNPRRSWRRT